MDDFSYQNTLQSEDPVESEGPSDHEATPPARLEDETRKRPPTSPVPDEPKHKRRYPTKPKNATSKAPEPTKDPRLRRNLIQFKAT